MGWSGEMEVVSCLGVHAVKYRLMLIWRLRFICLWSSRGGEGGGESVFMEEFKPASYLTHIHTHTCWTPSGKKHFSMWGRGGIKVFSLKNTHLITLCYSYSFCMFATVTATCTQQQNVLKDLLGQSKQQRWGDGVESNICWLVKGHIKYTHDQSGKEMMGKIEGSWNHSEKINTPA